MAHNNGNHADNGREPGVAPWFCGLLIGVVGGATLAFLTAPKSGTEIRRVIKRTTKDVPEVIGEFVDDSLDLYASALNYCQLLMEEQTNRIRRAVAAGKLAAAKKREELEMGENAHILPFQSVEHK